MVAGNNATMNGINSLTGKRLSGIQHLRQSITDILGTRIGTRVMRRAYGSRIPSLIDAPMNRATLIDIYAATAEALQQWEPRFSLEQVQAVVASPGYIELDLYGEYLPDGQKVTIDGIVIDKLTQPEANVWNFTSWAAQVERCCLLGFAS